MERNNNLELMKLSVLKIPASLDYSGFKNDLEAMREIANQPGIHPMILCYVSPEIQNDYNFISSIIINTNDIEDFYNADYYHNTAFMQYEKEIGPDIQKNPMFWELLNAALKKRATEKGYVPYQFDTAKEIEAATKYFDEEHQKKF